MKEVKDIIDSIPLDDGFVLVHSSEGYFLCMVADKGMEILLRIGKEAYNCICKREALNK